MIMEVLGLIGAYMIPFMGISLLIALVIRYTAYISTVRNTIYYNSFCSSVDKLLSEKFNNESIEKPEEWLMDLMVNVMGYLPRRIVRAKRNDNSEEVMTAERIKKFQLMEDFDSYSNGHRSIIHAIQHQMRSFLSPVSPDFSEITHQILKQDRLWRQSFGLSIDRMTKVFDILPGLFVIGGIFGTFVAIAGALPRVGAIDMSHIQESAPVLKSFIEDVAVSMKCSITGIFCSMIMTVLINVFPIYSARTEVRRSLQRALEHIWFRIHGSNVSYADRQIITLLKQIHLQLTQGVWKTSEETREEVSEQSKAAS
jgi:hypothetical protein